MVTLNHTMLGGKAEGSGGTSWSGILFWLNAKAQGSKLYHLGNWDVEISGSNFIVARTTDVLTNAEMREKGYNVCEKALDIFCADGLGGLHIISPFERNLLLSNTDGKASLWISCAEDFTLSMQAAISVQDKDGNIIPSVPRPQTAWENVYSYYRYSKLSNNIYDEYRWMYLVFEILMQKIAPIGFDAVKNKPTEKEGRWILRALREADTQYGWITAMNWPTTDPVMYFYNEQYDGVRCNLFHSKGGHLQPNEQISLDTVFKHLKELERLCIYLMRRIYNISTNGGGVTYSGFEMFMNGLFDNASAFLSEVNIKPLGSSLSLNDVNPFLCLDEISEKAVRENEVVIHVFHAPFPEHEERKVRSYGVKSGDELAIYDYPYEHTLSVQGIDDVYLIQMIKLVNKGDKKQHKHNGIVSSYQISV